MGDILGGILGLIALAAALIFIGIVIMAVALGQGEDESIIYYD